MAAPGLADGVDAMVQEVNSTVAGAVGLFASPTIVLRESATAATAAGGGGRSTTPGRRKDLSIEETVSREIVRKLRLAKQADTKDDAGVICEEVFFDICGHVDAKSRSQLQLLPRKSGPLAFYEILARHCVQSPGLAEELLSLCQSLWGHSYAASIYVLLLHRWLLSNRDAGGAAFRVKNIGVMCQSARNLFMGDIQTGTQRVRPLYHFFADEFVLSPPGGAGRLQFDLLAPAARLAVLAVVAAVLPYYAQPQQMQDLLSRFPPPTRPTSHSFSKLGHSISAAASSFVSSYGSTSRGLRTSIDAKEQEPLLPPAAAADKDVAALPAPAVEIPPGSGADFLVQEVAITLRLVKLESSVLKYLAALAALQGSPHSRWVSAITKLTLQDELYSLTSSGGPNYHSKAVRHAAMRTLDSLFPLGKTSRKLVRFFFRLIHPSDWLGNLWTGPLRWVATLYGRVIRIVFGTLYSLVVGQRRAS